MMGGKDTGRMPEKKEPASLGDGLIDRSDAAQEAGVVAKRPQGISSSSKGGGAGRKAAQSSMDQEMPASGAGGGREGVAGQTTGGASSVGSSALGKRATVVYDEDENSEADEREGMEDGSVACWNCRYSLGSTELGLVPYVACVQGSDVCIHRMYRTLDEAQAEYAERDIREADYLDEAADEATMATDALVRRAARLKELK